MVVVDSSDKGLTLQIAPACRTMPSALTAPWARARRRPPSPPDRRPLRRGGRPSPETASAGRPAGFNRQVARRGLFPSAGVLAAAALLALSGALALPVTAEAQTATTLVSNINQSISTENRRAAMAQSFTTGSNAAGYILTGVDVVSSSSTGFTAQVCGVDTSLVPTSACTDLTAPSTFAVGTMSFTAANTVLTESTTYAVVVTALTTNVASTGESWTGIAQGWGIAKTDDEDADPADGWSLSHTRFLEQA